MLLDLVQLLMMIPYALGLPDVLFGRHIYVLDTESL